MLLKTKHFGEIEIQESKIVSFEEGLPGFEGVRKFILLLKEGEASPFKWLQSVDDPQLAFVVVDPFAVKKDYDIDLGTEEAAGLGLENAADALVYAVVVVPEDISKISMNLKAPVIINQKNNRGMQVILDTDKYGVRHYILEELHRQEGDVNACSHKEEGPVHNHK